MLKGIYVLIIKVSKPLHSKIGALGKLTFPTGLYAYVGSAQNNLELRVKRHFWKEKRLFWHIDYLLNNEETKIINVYYKDGDKVVECQIASLLEANGKAIIGFGCSDCNCNSHLFQAKSFKFLIRYLQPWNNKKK